MTAIKEDECLRGIDIGGETQLTSPGNGQLDIGKLPAFINFIIHVLLSFLTSGFIIPKVLPMSPVRTLALFGGGISLPLTSLTSISLITGKIQVKF